MKKLQHYTPEFRAEAIHLVFEQSLFTGDSSEAPCDFVPTS